ncbi:uncharacterized protein LOC111306535 [Durio zibethinus]|uniref:Uncharacterized protein LOC111306535 n=1 Tax=Durio zibethinus TaxID=66656 RepID=A0A6P6A552_DURZI|nr:uncharacterized protein LOC111306535 [Durio zibethinus]
MNKVSEVAGFGVGTLLVCATIAAPKVDAFISASGNYQMPRLDCTKKLHNTSNSMGLCKRCGDLRMIACSRCRGTGLTKENGPFSFSAELKVKSIGCTKCQSRGHFSCPDCSNIPKV